MCTLMSCFLPHEEFFDMLKNLIKNKIKKNVFTLEDK